MYLVGDAVGTSIIDRGFGIIRGGEIVLDIGITIGAECAVHSYHAPGDKTAQKSRGGIKILCSQRQGWLD